MLTLDWPQILYLGLNLFGLGATVAAHGKPLGPVNAWYGVVGWGVSLLLLYWGGFFG